MSEATIFIVGMVVFALTVYGTVMAGGIALTRRQLDEHPELKAKIGKGDLDHIVPTKVRY